MPRLTRFHSFLDRFEERMQMDCERMKRQLIAHVDGRFGILSEKVAQLRNQFGCGGQSRSARSAQTVELSDDPQVETVELDEWRQSQDALVESIRSVPSTSTLTVRKRKSSNSSGTVTNKRQKTRSGTTVESNKHQCKSPGCGKSFPFDVNLAPHERIHLAIRPFSCTWPDCRHSAVRKDHLVQHVRTQHFKLPGRLNEQSRLNKIENRNPEDYVRVDRELLQLRLE